MKEIETRREDHFQMDSLQKNLIHTQEEFRISQNRLNLLEKNFQALEEDLGKARQENKVLFERIENMTHLLSEKDMALAKSLATLAHAEQELAKMVAPLENRTENPRSQPPPVPVAVVVPPPIETELAKIPLPDDSTVKASDSPKLEAPPPPAPIPPPWQEALDCDILSLRKLFATRPR